MYTLMLYSLKVGACLAVFYLFFKLLLSRETFHRLNRIVVLAAMVLSFVLPLCVITVYRELPAMPELPVTEEAGYAPSAEPESQPFPWDKAAGAQGAAGRRLRARTHRPAGRTVQLVPVYRDVGKGSGRERRGDRAA